ncbi:MAG: succinyl-diaminopimelate desuccinylase [Chromatiales bacterium]|nr:succinyl-diaminopimelate desuccinylase [Chromatiales bacterium]
MDSTLELAAELIRRQSVTPADEGCQQALGDLLAEDGFTVEHLRFGKVDNLWARHGTDGPLVVFLGHTDVVPTGPAERWSSPPFEPTLRDGILYGRGAADMKGSVAAFVLAAGDFVRANPNHPGSVAVLLTSDEEGPATDGTVRVVETLAERGERIDYCIVGEPSSRERLGDVIKVGRRGSLGLRIVVHGTQGHVAYPHLVDNPIHRLAAILADLAAERWDDGEGPFPPTSFQVSNLHAGTGADNVVPGTAEALCNWRFSTALDEGRIRARVEAIAARHAESVDWHWRLSGQPFLTRGGRLVEAVAGAVRSVAGIDPERSTAGGTSDGRFVAPTGAEVVELGPVNASIHKIDEHVRAEDLSALRGMYLAAVTELLSKN